MTLRLTLKQTAIIFKSIIDNGQPMDMFEWASKDTNLNSDWSVLWR